MQVLSRNILLHALNQLAEKRWRSSQAGGWNGSQRRIGTTGSERVGPHARSSVILTFFVRFSVEVKHALLLNMLKHPANEVKVRVWQPWQQ